VNEARWFAGLVAAFVLFMPNVAGAHGGANVAAIRAVFPATTEDAAIRVARCESRLYARAVGSAGERGLFQIHPVHFAWASPARLFDPFYNARVAYRLSRAGRSWSHWTCRP
jgi:soluble lytic murein transglycosylase-like protein